MNEKKGEKNIDYRELFSTLDEKDHFIQAIIGGAVVDQLLLKILSKFIIKENLNSIETMFNSDNSPFGSLSRKIHSCFYLGLIEKRTFRHLIVIKDIRNKFAHSFRKCDFNEILIKKKTAANKIYQIYLEINQENSSHAFDQNIDEYSSAQLYKKAILFYAHYLEFYSGRVERRKQLGSES